MSYYSVIALDSNVGLEPSSELAYCVLRDSLSMRLDDAIVDDQGWPLKNSKSNTHGLPDP
jgi:hypothetical protein